MKLAKIHKHSEENHQFLHTAKVLIDDTYDLSPELMSITLLMPDRFGQYVNQLPRTFSKANHVIEIWDTDETTREAISLL